MRAAGSGFFFASSPSMRIAAASGTKFHAVASDALRVCRPYGTQECSEFVPSAEALGHGGLSFRDYLGLRGFLPAVRGLAAVGALGLLPSAW